MEEIKIFIEQLVQLTGMTGSASGVVTHILLIIVVAFLSWLSGYLCRKVLMPAVLKLTSRTEVTWDDKVFNATVLTSACHIVPAIVVWQLLPLVFSQNIIVNELLKRATAIYIVIMSVRTMVVFIDSIKQIESEKYVSHKGDWITVPSTNANGTVEEMTLTTVKIRNFDNTIVTVSPQTLVNGSFQNWVGMQQSAGRRVTRTLYYDIHTIKVADDTIKENLLRHGYFTEEELNGEHVNMTLLCRYMEKFLSMQPEVNTSMQFMVHQLNPTTTGLPVEFYFFLTEKDWIPYEHQLADIMNRIYAMTPDFGLKIYQRYPQV